MKTVVSLLCLGLAFASVERIPSTISEYEVKDTHQTASYTPGKEFKYFYDGQILSGIPKTSSQRAGQRIQAIVNVYPVTADRLVIQLDKVRFGSLNKRIHANSQNRILPFDSFETAQLTEAQKQQLEQPFEVSRRDGKIASLKYGQEEEWVVNVKRSIMNLLSADLKSSNAKHLKSEYCPENQDCAKDLSKELVDEDGLKMFWKQNEITVEGNCEVTYTVVKAEKAALDTYNITKAINLAKCTSRTGQLHAARPEVAYNWHLSQNCPGCEQKGKGLNASTIMSFNCFGDKRESCVIERATSVSVYTIPQLSDEMDTTIRAKANQSLILIDVSAKTPPALRTLNVQYGDSLEYSLGWDEAKEKFQMEGHDRFLNLAEYAKWGENKVQIIKSLFVELARELSASVSDKSVELKAPTTYWRVVKVMRAMTEQEFDQIHREIFERDIQGVAPEDAKAVRDVVHSAIGAAGTLPAVKHITKCIVQGKLSQWQAVMAVRQLQNARIVSPQMTMAVKEACEKAESQPALYQSCMLTLGSMYRTRCMPRENRLAINYESTSPSTCDKAKREEIVEYFTSRLTKEKEAFAKNIALIKALHNAGLPESIPELNKVIRDREYSEQLRSEAIFAAEHLRESVPRQVIQMLMPITMDKSMEPLIRISAANVIFYSQPDQAELATMAALINRKSDSRLVKSYIWAEMSGLANLTKHYEPVSECDEKLAKRARQAIRLVKDDQKVLSSSFISRMSSFESSSSNYGFKNNIYSFASNSSFVPSLLGFSTVTRKMGFNTRFLKAYITSHGLDKMFVNMLRNSEQLFGSQSRARRSALNNDIRSKLADLTSSFENFELEKSQLLATLNFMGQEAGFLPLNKDIAEWIMEQLKGMNKEQLSEKFNINYASILSERMYKVPTSLGLPIVVRAVRPILAQLKGTLGRINEGHFYVKDMNIMPTIVAQEVIKAEVWAPVVNSGVKLLQEVRVSQPIRGSLNKNFELSMQTPSVSRNLVTVIAEPRTFLRKWYEAEASSYVKTEAKPIISETHNRAAAFHYEKEILGLKFSVRGRMSPSFTEGSRSFPIALPLHGPNDFHIDVSKASSSCEEMKLKAQGSWNKLQQSPLQSSVHTVKINSESSDEDSIDATEFSSKSHTEKKLFLEAECGQYRALNLKYKASPGARIRKVEAELYKARNEPNYCADLEILYPEAPSRSHTLNSKVNARFLYAWGEQCKVEQSSKKVNVEIQAEMTKQKVDLLKETSEEYRQCTRETASPVECAYLLKEARVPNKFSVLIKYSDVDEKYKNFTQHALAKFSAAHIERLSINKYDKGPNGQIKAVIRVDPLTWSRQNVSIEEPGQTLHYKDISSKYLSPEKWLAARLFLPQTYTASCLVSDSRVKSFDGLAFRAPLTDCWTVLAKDCSKDNRFAVLMRKQTPTSPNKILAIVTKTQLVEVAKEGNSFRVLINGQAKQVADYMAEVAGNEIFAQQYGEKKVKITLPVEEVTVYFDGAAASVKVSAIYFAQQCGLCGHYNRDAQDVLRSPASHRESSVMKFFEQYQLDMNSCQKASNPSEYGFSEHIAESEREDRAFPKETEPKNLHRGRYHNGRYCISKVKVPTCKIGYSPINTSTKSEQYGCIEDQHEARKVARLVESQRDIERVPVTIGEFSHTIHVPTKCVREY